MTCPIILLFGNWLAQVAIKKKLHKTFTRRNHKAMTFSAAMWSAVLHWGNYHLLFFHGIGKCVAKRKAWHTQPHLITAHTSPGSRLITWLPLGSATCPSNCCSLAPTIYKADFPTHTHCQLVFRSGRTGWAASNNLIPVAGFFPAASAMFACLRQNSRHTVLRWSEESTQPLPTLYCLQWCEKNIPHKRGLWWVCHLSMNRQQAHTLSLRLMRWKHKT